ncbi:MAG: hypothetical protein ASARMPREDX12_007324 [Alectoria sarmentosa]|nr:MAG: hypothetical protein ASARMPREDX12_007324 [Alectoria sarmentosa]
MLVFCLLTYFLTLALAAPPVTSPSLALVNPAQINATFPPPPSLNHLPPSPYYYTTPSTPVTLKFYSYGLPLPGQNVLTVLNTGLRDVNAQLHPENLITNPVLHYSSGKVYLFMHQNGDMTWEVFEKTLWGLLHFVETYECVDFDFDVGEWGMERAFGTGVLGGFG